MRKTTSLSLFIFFTTIAFCQPGIEYHQWPIDSSWYTSFYTPQKEFIPFFDSVSRKFGVKNQDSIIISPQFDNVFPMFNAIGEKGVPIYILSKDNLDGWADL